MIKPHNMWVVGVFAKGKTAKCKADYSHSSSAELQIHGVLPPLYAFAHQHGKHGKDYI
jgi:hypothetical protein